MLSFLYSLPDLSVAILFACVVALVFIAAPLVRARLYGNVNDATSEIARATMTAVTGFTGAVLAFSLVQAQGNLRNVEKTVATEAMQLNQLDRLLTSYGDGNVAAIRAALRTYTESVVVDEWPRLAEHADSPRTGDLFRALTQRILAIEPTSAHGNVIYADLVRTIDALEESRGDRLVATDLGLPPIFWQVTGFLVVLLVAFAAFVEPQRALSLGGLGAGLALLITLVFIFDQPFLGHMSATPEPLMKVLQAMRDRAS